MTAEQVAATAASGITPLDFLLGVMRNEGEEQARRIDAAKAAAPYCHARLNAVEMSGSLALQSHEEWLSELDGQA